MTHYNRLSKISYNEEITSWHFRVKIHMIYHFYSYVTGSGPHWIYILADEDGTKMEMTIYEGYEDRFRGLEKQEGKWATNSRFTLNATRHTQVHIIDPLNNRLYMDFKNIHEIPDMNHRDRNYPIDVSNRSENTYLIDTMGVVFNTEAHFDDIESWIKCVATGDHAYAFQDGLKNMNGRGHVILVLKMWRVWRFSSSIRFCRRLRSSDNRSITVTLMFGGVGL
ncbi:BnaCnng71500D [Brassica napus]|uniref:Replication protein A 70 kDa DNA-binding subunit B/D first OB fold domain-containing protein n=2 Tax=Brassica TaxID=3705 RepID=A0A0D3BW93_BRAOL|nr:unnamed protein product [Brassica napus]CDY71134.1 BnaCnng71500D [Brassica napus]